MATGISTDSLKSIFSSVDGREFYGSAAVLEARSQYLANTIADDKDAPVMLSGSQQARRETQSLEIKKRRRDEEHRVQWTLAEQARQLSEQLAQQIAQLEAAFEAELGDAWREEIANRVMSPDDIPQRKSGESMSDYRERLETALIAVMIDPATGQIRPEYANSDDPNIQRYAAWAQAQYRKNRIENASQVELESLVEESRSWAGLKHLDEGLSGTQSPDASVDRKAGELLDEAADVSSENAAFPDPVS